MLQGKQDTYRCNTSTVCLLRVAHLPPAHKRRLGHFTKSHSHQPPACTSMQDGVLGLPISSKFVYRVSGTEIF